MRPIKQWVTHYHQTILSLSANMLKKHVFGSFNLNNSELFGLSFDDIFLGTLDTNTKTMYPPSAVLGGGVQLKLLSCARRFAFWSYKVLLLTCTV